MPPAIPRTDCRCPGGSEPFLAVAFGVSLSVIDGTIANVALPTIGQKLGISSADSI